MSLRIGPIQTFSLATYLQICTKNYNFKLKIFKLLNAEKIGVSLTESMAMYPNATVSGYYFSHPESKYFSVGKIKNDQIKDYAKRKNQSLKETNKWLSSNI